MKYTVSMDEKSKLYPLGQQLAAVIEIGSTEIGRAHV
jgi:hypothetical protein